MQPPSAPEDTVMADTDGAGPSADPSAVPSAEATGEQSSDGQSPERELVGDTPSADSASGDEPEQEQGGEPHDEQLSAADDQDGEPAQATSDPRARQSSQQGKSSHAMAEEYESKGPGRKDRLLDSDIRDKYLRELGDIFQEGTVAPVPAAASSVPPASATN